MNFVCTFTFIFLMASTSFSTEFSVINKPVPSYFYSALQKVQKDYFDVKNFEPDVLVFLEKDFIVYYNYKTKKPLGQKPQKQFEQEMAHLMNSKTKYALYFEQNKDKPNQIFLLQEVGDSYELKNLSLGESLRFRKSLSQGVSTVFGEKFYKHRYVNIIRVSSTEIAIMADGKFYFTITD